MKSSKRITGFAFVIVFTILGFSMFALPQAEDDSSQTSMVTQQTNSSGPLAQEDSMSDEYSDYPFAVIGGGCFWCIEAVYEPIDGILAAVSGYAGGETKHPTYQQVSSGTSGHAEVVKIIYDPEQITYEQILQVFFHAHDPTTLNRQGYDVGSQYRSIILPVNEEQVRIAEAVKQTAQEDWPDPIVTEIQRLEQFFPAEDYHQDFYENNPNYGYCNAVIRPKLEKLGLEGADSIEVLQLNLYPEGR